MNLENPAELESLAFFMGAKASYDKRLGIAWSVFENLAAQAEFDKGYSFAEWRSALVWRTSRETP